MKTITLEVARGLLARAVLTQGTDFRYCDDRGEIDCRYEPQLVGGRPGAPWTKTGCLIGVAISLSEWKDIFSYGFQGSIIEYNTYELSFLTPGAALYWQEAQKAQDGGLSWGEAYQKAEEYLVNEYAFLDQFNRELGER